MLWWLLATIKDLSLAKLHSDEFGEFFQNISKRNKVRLGFG